MKSKTVNLQVTIVPHPARLIHVKIEKDLIGEKP